MEEQKPCHAARDCAIPPRPEGTGFPAQMMKVFLDDERNTPEGWIRVYWPDEAIELLKQGSVTEISLDHDLGDDERGKGYDVVLWIEEAVALHGFVPPKIYVHSSNTSAADKMRAGIAHIQMLARANLSKS